MLGELRRIGIAEESRDILTTEILDSSYRRIAKNYDPTHGGFGSAPKFPPAMTLEFVLHIYHRTRAADALEMVQHTARKMAEGGMYDQLGGGFHRYSVDAKWLVPHFEKMLYDNALLSRLYLHLYQLTKDDFARRIAEETLDYVAREMTDARGGFYSSQDADSEGEEGKFFVWSREEIVTLLGEQDAAIFCDYFDVSQSGNFEGQNILHVTKTLEDVASKHKVSSDHARKIIETGRQKLFAVREQRVKPGRDEKVLTGWNGFMLTSFAEASAILDRADYREVASANASFLLTELQRDGLLLRTYKDGAAKLNGYLEDYASLVDGLISLYEATGELEWIEAAIKLANTMVDQFWDDESGGFFFTGKTHEKLIVRSKEWLDNATPSGNSTAALVLLRLSALTANDDYRRRATTILRLVTDQVRRYPSAFGLALQALDLHLSSPLEIAIVGSESEAQFTQMRRTVWDTYLPNRVISLLTNDFDRAAEVVPLLAGRNNSDGPTAAYICRSHTCEAPVFSAADLGHQLNIETQNASQPGL
jgi:uncharacterized protein YyaL (SSP411 family)